LGLGSVWALGLSSSAALLQATKSAIPAPLLAVTGVIPLTQTIFLWQNLAMAAILITMSVVIAYLSAPRESEARTAREMGVIFEMISKTSVAGSLAHLFVHVTTRQTFPLVVAIYSAILGMFVPSGGGKWVVEAPYVMAAAKAWGMHLGWTVQIYNAAEALPNL